MHKISITNNKETLIPIEYILSYKTGMNKALIHDFKFDKNLQFGYIKSLEYLSDIVYDYIIDTYIELYIENDYKNNFQICIITPPSTMYEKAIKNEDSMYTLMKYVMRKINSNFNQENNNLIIYKKIIKLNNIFDNNKAQHLNSNKKIRIENINDKYELRFFSKKFFNKYKRKNIIFLIIDDVSSTGSTLFALQSIFSVYGKTLCASITH